jgi:cobalt-precorrin-5B (C1)-methyltransferase
MKDLGFKTGLSTGACAAAAAKGAAIALFTGRSPHRVVIRLPQGDLREVPILSLTRKRNAACCRVVKERVERGDVTGGLAIAAVVRRIAGCDIVLRGGRGIGVVTKPGLEVPVGEKAINPVPRRMIVEAVTEVIRDSGHAGGCEVIISIPGGERAALRTLNERLGIVGGLSVLGTTGLVIPYSKRAFKASLRSFFEVARSNGFRKVALAGGRRSERCALRYLDWPEECHIITGDHFDEGLRLCVELEFEMASIWAMPAKMLKLAAGFMNTHWTTGCDSSEVLMSFLCSAIPHRAGFPEHAQAKSVSFILQSLHAHEKREVLAAVCDVAAQKCFEATGKRVKIQCQAVSEKGVLLASSVLACGESVEDGETGLITDRASPDGSGEGGLPVDPR